MAQIPGAVDIEKEFSKNANLKREDMETLRQWAQTQFHFPKSTDLLLFLCLHSCYYDLEAAKRTMISYHMQRKGWPEVFRNRNLKTGPFLAQSSVSVEWPLKQSTSQGYQVFFVKLMDSDVSKYDMDGQLKVFFAVMDLWISRIGNCEGYVFVFDCRGITWKHLPKFDIPTARKLVAYVQEAFPVRLKEIHIMYCSAVIEKVLFITKLFMKRELVEIIHVHNNFESLSKYIPKTYLPKDCGRDDVTIMELHEMMKYGLLANCEFFLEDEDQERPVENESDLDDDSFINTRL